MFFLSDVKVSIVSTLLDWLIDELKTILIILILFNQKNVFLT